MHLREMIPQIASKGKYEMAVLALKTSQTCPQCAHRHKPRGRVYTCGQCGFSGHRQEALPLHGYPQQRYTRDRVQSTLGKTTVALAYARAPGPFVAQQQTLSIYLKGISTLMDYHPLKAKVNSYLLKHVGGAQRPAFFDVASVCPALEHVTQAYPVIRQECDRLLAQHPALPRYHEIDPGQTNISA